MALKLNRYQVKVDNKNIVLKEHNNDQDAEEL
jgi:hypothetical protein